MPLRFEFTLHGRTAAASHETGPALNLPTVPDSGPTDVRMAVGFRLLVAPLSYSSFLTKGCMRSRMLQDWVRLEHPNQSRTPHFALTLSQPRRIKMVFKRGGTEWCHQVFLSSRIRQLPDWFVSISYPHGTICQARLYMPPPLLWFECLKMSMKI
jgi:hypothetical protein